MARESRLQAQIIRYLHTIPQCRAISLNQDELQSGEPDILCVYKGLAHFFEVKVGRGEPTTLQLETLKKWLHTRAVCAVVSSVDDVRRHLQEGFYP